MSDEVGGRTEKVSFSGGFVWIPLLLSFVSILVLVLVKFFKYAEDDGFSWGTVTFYSILILLGFFAVSVIWFLVVLVSSRSQSKGKSFNSRDFCEAEIRDELKRKTGHVLKDFTLTQDSFAGCRYAGRGGEDLVFYHLFRIQKGSRMRYLLACMNMEQGKEDVRNFYQAPMNLSYSNTQEFNRFIDECCNTLVQKPVRFVKSRNTTIDNLSGRETISENESLLEEEQQEEESLPVQNNGGRK